MYFHTRNSHGFGRTILGDFTYPSIHRLYFHECNKSCEYKKTRIISKQASGGRVRQKRIFFSFENVNHNSHYRWDVPHKSNYNKRNLCHAPHTSAQNIFRLLHIESNACQSIWFTVSSTDYMEYTLHYTKIPEWKIKRKKHTRSWDVWLLFIVLKMVLSIEFDKVENDASNPWKYVRVFIHTNGCIVCLGGNCFNGTKISCFFFCCFTFDNTCVVYTVHICMHIYLVIIWGFTDGSDKWQLITSEKQFTCKPKGKRNCDLSRSIGCVMAFE